MDTSDVTKICLYCGGAVSGGACLKCRRKPRAAVNPPHCLKYRSLLRSRYVIAEPVGEGGSGITYSAFDSETGTRVAVKEFFPRQYAERSKSSPELVMKSQESRDSFSKGLSRFISEARRMMDLKSAGDLPAIESLFSENGTAYIVMEFVRGVTLRHFVRSRLIVSKRTAVSVLTPVFESIIALHEKGFIHCDISPDNIMVSPDRKGRLIDFGAAKRENFSGVDASALVKDGYSPPEMYQVNAHPSPAADVYSLAATIYFMCEKKPLPSSVQPKKIDEALDRIDDSRYGEQFLAVLDKALSERPEDRQQTVREFAGDLIAALRLRRKVAETGSASAGKEPGR